MDFTIKSLPEGISEERLKEWIAVLVERYHMQKMNDVEAVRTALFDARTNIDSFRAENGLSEKYKNTETEKETNNDI